MYTCCVCIVVHGCLGVSVRVGTTLLQAASALNIVACSSTWPSRPLIMKAMVTPPPKWHDWDDFAVLS